MISGRIITVMCAAALAAAFTAEAQTNVYRWVDKDGKVHFSDTPPPKDVKESSSKRMGGDAGEPQLPIATQEAMKRNPVKIYTSTDCGDLCENGRALLARRGIPYAERNAANKEDAEAVKKLVGALQVPVMLVGERTVKGFDEELWNSALDNAGYARAPLPGQNRPRQAASPAAAPPAPPPASGEPPPAPPVAPSASTQR